MEDKSKLVILCFLFLVLNISQGISQPEQDGEVFQVQYADTLHQEFKVLDIIKITKKSAIECRKNGERWGTWNGSKKAKKAYLIKLEGNEYFWYATVSLHDNKKKGTKIEIGKHYMMTLFPQEKVDHMLNHSLNFVVIIDGIRFCIPSGGWAANVYLTPNLKGLYYIQPK